MVSGLEALTRVHQVCGLRGDWRGWEIDEVQRSCFCPSRPLPGFAVVVGATKCGRPLTILAMRNLATS
jgi:hypothetical protein